MRKAKKAEKKLRQKKKKQSCKSVDKVDEESEPDSEDHPKETIVQQNSENTKPSDDIKDNLELETETFGFKSEEPRFSNFPSSFADWSEDQKEDAYKNNFKLYVKKYFFIPTGSLPQ